MRKKIVERGRAGPYRQTRSRAMRRRDMQDPESAPLRERMSRHDKYLNENLAPLRRYLLSKVGCKWNDVYSEIRANLRCTSATHLHVLEHLEQMVVTQPLMINGQPHRPCHESHNGPTPLSPRRWSSVVWVDPDTGLVRKVNPPPKATPAPNPDAVNVDENHVYRRLKGIWYRVTLSELPPVAQHSSTRDTVEECMLTEITTYAWYLGRELRARYGYRDRYASTKVQLNKRQLKKLRHAGILPGT